jgi:hypothetical protein
VKLEVTEAQLRAIINMADDMEGMLGNGGDLDEHGKEPDDYWRSYIRLVDRMQKKNGYSR